MALAVTLPELPDATPDVDLPPADPPVSVRRPVMVQRWSDVVFLHWRVDPDAVQRRLPQGVTVDTFDGTAWVGLVPFRMEGLGFPGLAPLPHVGAFPEVNVRTYVRAGGHRGVWFFSLDVDRALPARVARAAYRLPYFWGEADHGRAGRLVGSRVRRARPDPGDGASADVVVRTGAPLDPRAPLHRFLTGRWGLVAAGRRGPLWWAPVEHQTWPLHRAEVVRLTESLVTAAGLPATDGPPHAMWSPGVDVRVGRPRRIRG